MNAPVFANVLFASTKPYTIAFTRGAATRTTEAANRIPAKERQIERMVGTSLRSALQSNGEPLSEPTL